MTESGHHSRPGFAVVGLGKMGTMHAAMLGVVNGGRVGAVVDADPKQCDQLVTLGVDAPRFPDLEQCLQAVPLEGVWLATPQFTHREQFEVCFAHDLPVFCEKPLAHTLQDARAMAAVAAGKPHLPAGVGFMLGHNPVYARARELMDTGALGTVRSFKASCRLSQVFSPKKGWTFTPERAGGGVLINSGCHLIFALYRLFGMPASILARGGGVHNQVEDSLAALLDYPTGVWGQLEVTWSVPGHEYQTHDIEVTGTDGVLVARNDELRLWRAREDENLNSGWSVWPRTTMEPRAAFSLSPDYLGDEFFLEDQDFVDAVREGRQPKVDVGQSLAVQEIVDAIYRALAGGGVERPVHEAPLPIEPSAPTAPRPEPATEAGPLAAFAPPLADGTAQVADARPEAEVETPAAEGPPQSLTAEPQSDSAPAEALETASAGQAAPDAESDETPAEPDGSTDDDEQPARQDTQSG